MTPKRDNEPGLRVALLANGDKLSDLVTRELKGLGATVALRRIQVDDTVQEALAAFPADVILADASNGCEATREAYTRARMTRPSAPFIVLAERFTEDWVVSCARYNPDNVVLTGNLARLGPAIQGALEQRQPLATLSSRQLQVLLMIVEGLSTREIAEKIGLSIKTVESHRSAMMRRLGVRDLTSLVLYSVRMGLVHFTNESSSASANRSTSSSVV